MYTKGMVCLLGVSVGLGNLDYKKQRDLQSITRMRGLLLLTSAANCMVIVVRVGHFPVCRVVNGNVEPIPIIQF